MATSIGICEIIVDEKLEKVGLIVEVYWLGEERTASPV